MVSGFSNVLRGYETWKLHSKLYAQAIAKLHFTGSTRGFPSRVFDSYPILPLISVVSVSFYLLT